MTTGKIITCKHDTADWGPGISNWICKGCVAAVCTRCRAQYMAFPPLEGEIASWWTFSCDCPTQAPSEIQLPRSGEVLRWPGWKNDRTPTIVLQAVGDFLPQVKDLSSISELWDALQKAEIYCIETNSNKDFVESFQNLGKVARNMIEKAAPEFLEAAQTYARQKRKLVEIYATLFGRDG